MKICKLFFTISVVFLNFQSTVMAQSVNTNYNDIVILSPVEIFIKFKERFRNFAISRGADKSKQIYDELFWELVNSSDSVILEKFNIIRIMQFVTDGKINRPINDPVLFAMAVSSLKYNSDAAQYINRCGRYDHIYAFSRNIRPYLKERYLYKLFPKCDITEEERLEVLKTSIPKDMRAALGDTVEETKFIKKFKETRDISEKIELALTLAYINSPKTRIALVHSLDDSLTYVSRSSAKSISLYILVSLNKCFPDEPLFSDIPFSLLNLDDNRLPEGVLKNYITDIYVWTKQKFGIELKKFPQQGFIHKFIDPGLDY